MVAFCTRPDWGQLGPGNKRAAKVCAFGQESNLRFFSAGANVLPLSNTSQGHKSFLIVNALRPYQSGANPFL